MESALFFSAAPLAGRLFDLLEAAVRPRHPSMTVNVQRSQVTFCDPSSFCWCSLPRNRRPGPETGLMVSFGFDQRIDDPRIFQAVEPYPNRWTHHVLLTAPEAVDEQLLTWLDMSHHFRCVACLRRKKG